MRPWPKHNLPRPVLNSKILDVKNRVWVVTEFELTEGDNPELTIQHGDLKQDIGYLKLYELFDKKLMTVIF